jgi:hypothetical protein
MTNKLAQFLVCLVVSLGITSCILSGIHLMHWWRPTYQYQTTLVAVIVATSITFLLRRMRVDLKQDQKVQAKDPLPLWLRSFVKLRFLICLVVSYGIALWIDFGMNFYQVSARDYWAPTLGAFVGTSVPFLLDVPFFRQ